MINDTLLLNIEKKRVYDYQEFFDAQMSHMAEVKDSFAALATSMQETMDSIHQVFVEDSDEVIRGKKREGECCRALMRLCVACFIAPPSAKRNMCLTCRFRASGTRSRGRGTRSSTPHCYTRGSGLCRNSAESSVGIQRQMCHRW